MVLHASEDVRAAITRLSDALCSWERNTGIESVLIIREKDFVYRAINGKPNVPEDLSDDDIVKTILGD